MKREDFKEITEEHFMLCRKLIDLEGACNRIICKTCPFYFENSTNNLLCTKNGYCSPNQRYAKCDILVNSAKEFLKFKEENKVEKERVLEIEFQEIFDKVACRITYQNEEVLKRGEIYDEELGVRSNCKPMFESDSILYIKGVLTSTDDVILVVSKEQAEIIKQKVESINEKYGIPKRWRAEKGEYYWYIDSCGVLCSKEDNYYGDDTECYEFGNYFQTEEQAQEKLEKIKKILLEE